MGPSESERQGEVTRILQRLNAGDEAASQELFVAIYDELRRVAAGYMDDQRKDHTLQPTALVHEAFLRLVGRGSTDWTDRAHFFRTAAKAMRQILVDHARARKAAKRGAERAPQPLDAVLAGFEEHARDFVELDEALGRLGAMDDGLLRIVELRFFGGLTHEEIGRTLELSRATVERRWTVARSWLHRALEPQA